MTGMSRARQGSCGGAQQMCTEKWWGLGEWFGRGGSRIALRHTVTVLGPQQDGHPRCFFREGSCVTDKATEP